MVLRLTEDIHTQCERYRHRAWTISTP